MTESDAEEPIENMNTYKMTEEGAKKIAEIMSQIQKQDLLRIEARLESIENSIAASKEMAEIHFKDIDK
eukprot:5978679-Heterocapsa_arctica.AAC.1